MAAPPAWEQVFSRFYASTGPERMALMHNLRSLYEGLSIEQKVAAQRLTAQLDQRLDRQALLLRFEPSDAPCWQWAQYYVRHGLTPIPLHANNHSDSKSAGKIPCLQNWTWLPLADLLVEIRRIADLDPQRNLGLRTGPEIFVLDFDYKPDEGKDGLALLAELEQRFNGGQPFHTPTVVTGGGGRHVYFTATDLPSATGLCGGRLDLRSFSGQAVAPGSTHRRTGRPYEFAVGLGLGQVPILPLPVALRTWLESERPPSRKAVASAAAAAPPTPLAAAPPSLPTAAPPPTPSAFEQWQQPPIELFDDLLLQLCHLHADYCVNRDRWLTILWVLKRHHPTTAGLALAHRFSSWAGSAYDAEGVEVKWSEGRTDGRGPTIGTLLNWLRAHSPEAYQAFRARWPSYFGRFSHVAESLLSKGQAGFAEVATDLLRPTLFTSEREAYGWCLTQRLWISLTPDEVCVRVRDALEGFLPAWKAAFRADVQERLKVVRDPTKLEARLQALDRLREPHLNWNTLRGVANFVMVRLRNSERAALLNEAPGTEWLLPIAGGLMVDLRCPPGPENPRPRTPEDLFSWVAPVCYRPDADVSRWLKIFRDNHYDHNADDRQNEEIVAFWLKWLAYCLTADTRAQLFAQLVGPTASNGKSTVAAAMLALLGDFFQAIPHSLFLEGRQPAAGAPRSDVMAIRGKRFLYGAEPPLSAHLDGGLFKKVIGGDQLAERDLFQRSSETRSFQTVGKVTIAANDAISPKQVSDNGVLRKMLIFDFRTRYTDKPSRPFDKLCDPTLTDWVKTPEASSALLLLLWRQTPELYRSVLRRPDWMTTRVMEMSQVRSASDGSELGIFLAECCLQWPDFKQEAGALKEAFNFWWRERHLLGLNTRPPTEANLHSDLERHGHAYSVQKDFRFFSGIYLLSAVQKAALQSALYRQRAAREKLGPLASEPTLATPGRSNRNKTIRADVEKYIHDQEAEAKRLEAQP